MARWKKGDPSPNPKGRPKLPEEVKELKKLNQFELERRLNEFMQLTPLQLKRIKEDPESTTLELLIASIITHAVNKGDHQRFDFILNRLIGKIKDQIQLSGVDGAAIEVEHKFDAQTLKQLSEMSNRIIETLAEAPKNLLEDLK